MKKLCPANLLLRFQNHLAEKSFFKSGARILVACSGGPDSVALFHLLQQLSTENDWKLGILHFNHQLRPKTAKRDEHFVRRLAAKYRVPFFAGRGNVEKEAKKTQTSIEECARKMRYDFFLKTARTRKFPKIVLAHTQDDQAETVLMRILQGTGMRGLSGIREHARMSGVALIRPLLGFTKKELLSYLAENRIRFCSDESNHSHRFIRNRIRLKLIPHLEREYNPRLVQALSRIPAIVREENALISELEGMAWIKVFKKYTARKLELRRKTFLKLPAPLQFRMIGKALERLDARSGLSFEAWDRLRKGLARPRFCYSLPKDIDFSVTSKRVMLYKKKSLRGQKG